MGHPRLQPAAYVLLTTMVKGPAPKKHPKLKAKQVPMELLMK